MENGDTPWKKMIGDYLLQRLGVPTEYFEVMADARELNGWRDRQGICLVVFEQPQKAQQLLEVYQKKYRKKTPFEEQFLKKMQTILLVQAYKKSFESKSVDVEREKSEGENLVESARQTVLCTLPDGWEKKKLSKFLLAPCELESILLLANCLLLIGKTDEAMQMHKKVADYVKQAKFEPKVQILIYPQVAFLGMKLELYAGNEEKAFSYGMEALELLRHQYSQRYVVFVLEELLNVLECISVKGKEDQKYKEEETEVTEFLKTFEKLYRLFSHPKKRMWQSISVSNTHEIEEKLSGNKSKQLPIYYKYIFRNMSRMNIMDQDIFYDRYIADDFETKYIPKCFERICKQYLIRKNRKGLMDEIFEKIGKYYYDDPVKKRNGEFDIVTWDDLGYIFYEAKFRKDPVTESMIQNEIRQVKQTGLKCYKYGFFSRSGFLCEQTEDRILIGLDELYVKNYTVH